MSVLLALEHALAGAWDWLCGILASSAFGVLYYWLGGIIARRNTQYRLVALIV